MELFAIKIDGQDYCQVMENETMSIIGYLEQDEKGFYIHLDDREFWKQFLRNDSQEGSAY